MEKIDALFDFYKSKRKNEFTLKDGSTASACIVKKDDFKQKDGYVVLSDEILSQFSPDNIDISHFWKRAVQTFKYIPIINNNNIKSIKQLNEISFEIQKNLLEKIYSFLISNLSTNFLEIGPGYGAVKAFFKNKKILNQYFAIDVNPLFRFKKLYKCDGKNIPNFFPKELGIVYSFNVFQHLSPAQKTSYYQQIYERLIVSGIIIIGMYAYNENEKNISFSNGNKVFGSRDKNDCVYTSFFTQYTKIDSVENVENQLISFGFKKITTIQNSINFFTFIFEKYI